MQIIRHVTQHSVHDNSSCSSSHDRSCRVAQYRTYKLEGKPTADLHITNHQQLRIKPGTLVQQSTSMLCFGTTHTCMGLVASSCTTSMMAGSCTAVRRACRLRAKEPALLTSTSKPCKRRLLSAHQVFNELKGGGNASSTQTAA